ncbi:hypothetical protein Taro_021255, partial [Colocasia esculenta]|nr:hypothetical protein [Colocasia esculenta]
LLTSVSFGIQVYHGLSDRCASFSLEEFTILLGDFALKFDIRDFSKMKKNPKFFIQIFIFLILAYVVIVSSLKLTDI